jgi:KipI family sensor histidine kinase inhibitor
LIYAIGFSPAFAFLGEVDGRIQLPRLATPRIKIPAGSVGIAESQTAIYPADSSGGWNIVGRTLLDLSLNNPDNVDKFRVGDKVKFYSITRDEYIANGGLL